MSSLKLGKFMARLYARAGNSTVTLNRNDLEVLNNLINSEVERYETEIKSLTEQLARAKGGAIAYAGSTETSLQKSSTPPKATPTRSTGTEGGSRGAGDSLTDK